MPRSSARAARRSSSGVGLDVEEEDAGFERGVDLADLLAYAGEDDFCAGRVCAALATRSSSPPETMSKPAPCWARSLRMASEELALTA